MGLVGCFGPTEHPPLPETPPACEDRAAACPMSVAPPRGSLPAPEMPELAVGTALHYRSSGNYDITREFTVVVASRNESGYLFAGATKDDLTEDAIWDRDWFGPHDLQRNDLTGLRLFDMPLAEGKTWEITKGLAVIAHATPTGYRMVAADPAKSKLEYVYSNAIGYLQSYHSTHLTIDLTHVDKATNFVWYARGPGTGTSEGAPPATLDVPSAFDEVVAVAGGNAGAAAVQPPGGASPWTWQGGGAEHWDYAKFPAAPGKWAVAVTPTPGAASDFAYAEIAAVKWNSGTIP